MSKYIRNKDENAVQLSWVKGNEAMLGQNLRIVCHMR